MTLEFEEDKVNLIFEIDAEGAVAYHVHIYAKDKTNNGSKKKVHTSEKYLLAGKDNHYWIVMDYVFYDKVAKLVATSGKPLPNKIEFFFELEVEIQSDDQCAIEKEELSETLTLHFVRYIPKLMNIRGFTNGEYLLRLWFTLGSNIDKATVDPEIEAISWDWAMSESFIARMEYNDFKFKIFKNLNAWFSNKTKMLLRSEIDKMVAEGLINLPTKDNPRVPFGVLDNQIIEYKNEKRPKFEKYYFAYERFKGGYDLGRHCLVDGIDDFMASIASFRFRALAIGELVYDEGYFSDEIDIHIKQLGFYIKDNFDFIDDDPSKPSQPLAYWKIVDEDSVEISIDILAEMGLDISNYTGYYELTNKLFRDYRDDHASYEEGYNYHLYSDVHIDNVDITLKYKDI